MDVDVHAALDGPGRMPPSSSTRLLILETLDGAFGSVINVCECSRVAMARACFVRLLTSQGSVAAPSLFAVMLLTGGRFVLDPVVFTKANFGDRELLICIIVWSCPPAENLSQSSKEKDKDKNPHINWREERAAPAVSRVKAHSRKMQTHGTPGSDSRLNPVSLRNLLRCE